MISMIINIGLFFSAVTFIMYLIVLGMVMFEFATAYVTGRLPIRPRVVNWIFSKQFYIYTYTRHKYEEAGLDPDQALIGEYAAIIGVGGLLLVVVMIPLWPIILILLTLKVMREYNTNEQFRNLFEHDVQQKKDTPLKGIDR